MYFLSLNLIKLRDLILYFTQFVLEALEDMLLLLTFSNKQVNSVFIFCCHPNCELRDDCELVPAERVKLVEVVHQQTSDTIPQCVFQCISKRFMHILELLLNG